MKPSPGTRASEGRTRMLWAAVRDSLWFVPGLSALAGAGLAALLVQVPTPDADSRLAQLWLFGGGAEGARGVLSTIAGSLITVTGVVFSVTIVALQLASSQFTPRVLRSFVADSANQVVLGIFIGTFTYTLLVLRTTRSSSAGSEAFVPQIAVSVAVLLLLVSIGALIFFIDHAARSVQASVILHRETQQTLTRVKELFPAEIGLDDPAEDGEPTAPPGEGAAVPALESGYVQAVAGEALLAGAAERNIVVRLEIPIGDFVIAGRALATIWPRERCDDEVAALVRRAVVLGPERTPEQDLEFGIVEISDIAVRALSPGINDPTTAALCIDRLGEILVARGRRRQPAQGRLDADGRLRVIAPVSSFERAVGLAFDQIRHYGAGNPGIARKLLATYIELASLVPPSARRTLGDQVEAVLLAAHGAIEHPADLRQLEALGRTAHAVTGRNVGAEATARGSSSGAAP